MYGAYHRNANQNQSPVETKTRIREVFQIGNEEETMDRPTYPAELRSHTARQHVTVWLTRACVTVRDQKR